MNKIKDIIIRYLILLAVAIPNLWLFYKIFAPLTIYPIYFIFKILFDASLNGRIIYFKDFSIALINACIAGSAYYLLLIFNLSTPDIKLKKRLKLIFSSFLIFLILNIARIFFLSWLLYLGSDFFNLAHKVFWYALSTIFVVAIWFFQVKFYKIRKIPLYSDVKYIFNKSHFKKIK